MPRFLTLVFIALVLAVGAHSQVGQEVNVIDCPIASNCVQQYYYDATPNLQYICYAPSFNPVTVFDRGSATLTNIVVTTNVGVITFSSTSYLWVGAYVTVSGSTTAALNGTYPVTAVSGSTASIATSGVGNGTYNNAAMTVSTTSPLLNAAVWAVKVLHYNATPNLDGIRWEGPPSPNIPKIACSARATS